MLKGLKGIVKCEVFAATEVTDCCDPEPTDQPQLPRSASPGTSPLARAPISAQTWVFCPVLVYICSMSAPALVLDCSWVSQVGLGLGWLPCFLLRINGLPIGPICYHHPTLLASAMCSMETPMLIRLWPRLPCEHPFWEQLHLAAI